jgi:hypothetical protein
MAHYAQLDANNLVVNVFVGRDEDDLPEGVTDWEQYYAPEGFTVRRTSYNTLGGVHYDSDTREPSADQTKALRFNYAGIGYIYDEDRDAFIPPKPFESWVLSNYTCLWEAPEPYPTEGDWVWDEVTGSWVEVLGL